MGNCYEDPRPVVNQANPKQIIFDPMSQVLLNSTIISELKTLPSISKNILHRMEELGTFLPTGSKDFGPIYQLRNKSVYQGRLKNKLFHGPGRLMLSDGTLIESEFQNGQPKNRTRIFKPNGDYFSGVVSSVKDKLQKGIVHEKGITYQGQMMNQKPHGYGKQHSKSYSFSGTYQNGKKVNGLLQWHTDTPKLTQSYEGGFQDNVFQGQGTLTNSEGTYVGNFVEGIKSGYGEFTYPDQKVYKGAFRKNKPDGEGKLYQKNGAVISQGTWINGKYFNNQFS